MVKKILIIAEAGVNHNGDIEVAKKLVDAAVEAGVDFIKFQSFNPDLLVTRIAKKANYQLDSDRYQETQYEMLARLTLSKKMHVELIDYCNSRSICFLSSAFDIESLEYLISLNLRYYKVPSGEITNLPYLRYLGGFNKNVILSTGMSTLAEVDEGIRTLQDAGTSRSNITLLHCTSEYPSPMEDINLLAMSTLGNAFGIDVGYSDHSIGIEIPIAAAALGAKIIEKHFTLDKTMAGPDHKASLNPDELKLMVSGIRNIEVALGDGVKKVSPHEAKNRSLVRKSIVASRPIAIGEIFSENNLTVKRPGEGLSPMFIDFLVGQKARRNYLPDDLIDL
jgi:N,N'-diacetyllegionaminate synthase